MTDVEETLAGKKRPLPSESESKQTDSSNGESEAKRQHIETTEKPEERKETKAETDSVQTVVVSNDREDDEKSKSDGTEKKEGGTEKEATTSKPFFTFGSFGSATTTGTTPSIFGSFQSTTTTPLFSFLKPSVSNEGEQSNDTEGNSSIATPAKPLFDISQWTSKPSTTSTISNTFDFKFPTSESGGFSAWATPFGSKPTGSSAFESSSKTSGGEKTQVQEKTVTGEEDEKRVHSVKGKLYIWVPEEKRWREKGEGKLHLNVSKKNEADARLVMRVEAAFRLILNAKIFPRMVSEKAGDKMVRITVVGGVPEDDPQNQGKLNSYMIRVSRKDEADELLEQIQKYTQLSVNATPTSSTASTSVTPTTSTPSTTTITETSTTTTKIPTTETSTTETQTTETPETAKTCSE